MSQKCVYEKTTGQTPSNCSMQEALVQWSNYHLQELQIMRKPACSIIRENPRGNFQQPLAPDF
jgi:hypothetical protein